VILQDSKELDELIQAIGASKTLSAEEKRLEMFEILEPQFTNYWKEFKFNQGMLYTATMVLLEIEYFGTDLTVKLLKRLVSNVAPGSIDRLIPLYEKLSELNGKIIRQKSIE